MFWRPQGICMKLKDNTRSLPLSFIMFYGGFIQATSFCRKSRDWSGESQCRGSCEALKPERVTKFSKHFFTRKVEVPLGWKPTATVNSMPGSSINLEYKFRDVLFEYHQAVVHCSFLLSSQTSQKSVYLTNWNTNTGRIPKFKVEFK